MPDSSRIQNPSSKTLRVLFLCCLLFGLLVCALIPYAFHYPFDAPGTAFDPVQLEAFHRAEQYAMAIRWGGLFAFFIPIPAILLVLTSGWALVVERRFGKTPLRWPARILFLVGYFIFMKAVMLPYGIRAFLHGQAFDMTHLTLLQDLGNTFRGMPVALATFLLASLLTYCCMPIFGRWWWLGAAVLLFLIFQVIPEKVSRMQPMDPVEDRALLEAGPVHDALSAVADTAGMDLAFYVVDESKRTERINMYLTGRVGREYVVMTDNALAACSPDELRAILAHELGHQVTRFVDVINTKVLTGAKVLVIMLIIHLWGRRRAVAEEWRLHTLIRILLVTKLVTLPLIPLTSALNRYREREADEYALALTADPESLHSALLTVARANLTTYDVPTWSYGLAGTHPRLKDRLALAEQWSRNDAPDPAAPDLSP